MNINKNKIGEMVEIVGKTAISAIPIGGTLITCVWDTVKANAMSKRFEEWKTMVEDRLSFIDVSLEDLGNNDNFATCLLKTTELSAKTGQKKKREYLANALVNSISIGVDENILMIFLALLEAYTEIHMVVLGYFHNPQKYENVRNSNLYMGAPITLFYETFPELESQSELINIIIKELYSDGLLNTDSMVTMMTIDGIKAKRTTTLGGNFISFISDTQNVL